MYGIDDLFDVVDLLFDLIELFNAVLQAILNFGDFLNGGSGGGGTPQVPGTPTVLG